MRQPARLLKIAGATLLAAGLVACAQTAEQAPVAAPSDVTQSIGDRPAPDGKRWQYGSGEAAGATIQAWRALADYALARAQDMPAQSVVMGMPGEDNGIMTGSVSCIAPDGARKPYAVIADADDTVIQNLGFAYWQAIHDGAYDREVWADYMAHGAPHIAPVPGAITGIRRLREGGVTVI